MTMSQIIENWCKITGTITGASRHKTLPGYIQLKIKLEQSEAIDDFPNLSAADEGKTILVNIPEAMYDVDQYNPGQHLIATVRKASAKAYFIRNG